MGLGLGLGIWWPTQTSIIPGLLKALCARATYCENKLCTTATLEEIAAVRYTPPPPPPPPGLLLEDYPGASAAYSLRNLIDTTTNVVRVRRSSDNTEQDFTSTEITDGTLITFTGIGFYEGANLLATFTSNGVDGFEATDTASFGNVELNTEGVLNDVVEITFDASNLTGNIDVFLVGNAQIKSNIAIVASGANTITLTATGNFDFLAFRMQNQPSSITVNNFTINRDILPPPLQGYISKWYDQSSLGLNDAVQSTATNQPKLVSNGVVVLDNGKPAIEFIDTFQKPNWLNTSYSTSQPISVALVGKSTTTNFDVFYSGDTSQTRVQQLNYEAQNYFSLFAGTIIEGALYDNNRHLWFNLHNITNSSMAQDGVITATGNNGSNSLTGFQIGSMLNGQYALNGYIQELILYPSDQSANRTGIETNINTEYTIY